MAESLKDAVDSGNELRILYATRNIVAGELEVCESGRDVAALSNRIIEISQRITELEKQQKPKRKTALESVRAMKK